MTNTVNIRYIYDQVLRHPMLRDVTFEEVVEYTIAFIQLMATPALYEEKTAVVPICDWRGQLPGDFERMIQVRVASTDTILPGAVYRYATDSFHMSPDKTNLAQSMLTYKLQGNVIFTSTKDMDVEIAYRAFAVDEDGYPLLPDNANFIRGLKDYIKVERFTVLFDMGKISSTVLNNAQQEYTFAAAACQSEFSRLSLDEAESLFNSFKSLLPRTNEHSSAFRTLGAKKL